MVLLESLLFALVDMIEVLEGETVDVLDSVVVVLEVQVRGVLNEVAMENVLQVTFVWF